MSEQYFTTATFRFLRDLAAHNDRQWMADNKQRYIDEVQEPALEFIDDFRPRLRAISPHFRADATTVGGSLFRIHRDTRFAKDKTPYKENTGLQFRHEMAKDAHAPGFYLHIQPGECFVGVGLWRPETKVAYQIRQLIADDPNAWIEASRGGDFAATYALAGESLKRPPKGFDAESPLIDDLKRKDFIASSPLTQKTVTSSSFIDHFDEMCQSASKFMSFLCSAVGVPY